MCLLLLYCSDMYFVFVPHSEQLKKHLHLLPVPRTTAAAAAAAAETAVVNILRRSRVAPEALHFGLILN